MELANNFAVDFISYIDDMLVNLLAAAIDGIVVYAYQNTKRTYRLRKAKGFWKAISTQPILIVMGRFKEFREFEQSGFLGVGMCKRTC